MPLVTFSPSTTAKSADVNANFAGLANGSLMNSPSIANLTLTTKFVAGGLYDNGNSGSAATINWANGDRQKITLTAACTLSYSNAIAGQCLILELIENATGNFSITLPAGTKYTYGVATPFDTTPNATNLISVFFDGSNYLTQIGASFS